MRKTITILVVLAGLVAPAGASALTHRQIADQHAYAHCVQLNCEYGLDHIVTYMGGEEYFYWMTWRGYGFHCHYGPPLPSVVVSDVYGVAEYNWTSANAYCEA